MTSHTAANILPLLLLLLLPLPHLAASELTEANLQESPNAISAPQAGPSRVAPRDTVVGE